MNGYHTTTSTFTWILQWGVKFFPPHKRSTWKGLESWLPNQSVGHGKKWMATTESTWKFFGHPKLIALFPCRVERFEKLPSKEVTPALLQKNFSKAEFWTSPFCSPVNHHPIFSDFFYQIHSHFDQVRFTWPHPEDQVDHPWSQLQTSFPGIIFVHIFCNRWSQETHKPILSAKKHMFVNLDHLFRGELLKHIWKHHLPAPEERGAKGVAKGCPFTIP